MSSAVGKLFGGGESQPAPAPAAPKAPEVEARAPELAVREQVMGQRAANAGAVRSGNEADVLGYSLPRKRSAGREILG